MQDRITTLADMENVSSNERTHIYRLNCDLLLHIFEINANMFGDCDALRTTRRASQVCRGWRSLLLETPWIWARLLDMGWPRRRWPAPEWLAELLRRTGSAPLWINARNALVAESPSHISRFIFAILTNNWYRVERLVLRVEVPRWSVQNADLWGWVYTPAPQLKVFDVYFGSALTPHPSSVPLFADNAPALRSLVSDHHPIDLHASWLPNLRCLDIDAPCTPAEAVIALQSTKNLECLTLGLLSTPEADSEPGVAHLSKLRELTLITGLEHCPFLLSHIYTALDCSFMYWPPNIEEDHLAPHILVPAVRALGDFAKRTLNVAAPTHLGFYSDYYTLHFRYGTKLGTPTFRLGLISPRSSLLPYATTSIIIDAFTCVGFTSVTDLIFRIPLGMAPDESLMAFLENLSAVETLTTGQGELRLLVKVQNRLPLREGGPTEVFPALKTIILSGQEYAAYSSLDTHSSVGAFVEARRAAGNVVTVRTGRDGEDVFRDYM
ncbi:hypothetical protein HYPSUDRAFT_36425 [Hypholoma sublateritium FD-334 SS-4]|uniref:Uncharacterized protein n=1 Tax=Hypholoma sublateritium (strain FD-334 SS-4) TaxID=945553 RepID=A0A0D2LGH2_HYPSF|nr:hypothetical protein HYPSUDRAFT_36425 [Hypholoma sublateritium FD-334 SS-4]